MQWINEVYLSIFMCNSPGLILFSVILLLLLIPAQLRQPLFLMASMMTLIHILALPQQNHYVNIWRIGSLYVTPFYIHPISKLFAAAFLISGTVLLHFVREKLTDFAYTMGMLLMAISICICYAGDVITLYTCLEIAAVLTFCLLCRINDTENAAALKQYAVMHCLGGAFLLAGLSAYIQHAGNVALPAVELNFSHLRALWQGDKPTFANICMVLGLVINIAAFPFSAWLPTSYTKAPPAHFVLIATFPTKLSLFALILCIVKSDIVVMLGIATSLYGALYALTTIHMRALLCYSMMSNVGMIMVAKGVLPAEQNSDIAVFVVCHLLYQLLVLMLAYCFEKTAHRETIAEVGKALPGTPFILPITLIAMTMVCGAPFTLGYIAKMHLMLPLKEGHYHALYIFALIHNSLVCLHTAYRFMGEIVVAASGVTVPEGHKSLLPRKMHYLLISVTTLLAMIGFFPRLLYALIANVTQFNQWDLSTMAYQLVFIAFSGAGYIVCREKRVKNNTILHNKEGWYIHFLPYVYQKLRVAALVLIIKRRVHHSVELLKAAGAAGKKIFFLMIRYPYLASWGGSTLLLLMIGSLVYSIR